MLAAVEAAVAARDCRDAVVRLRLDGLARDVYQALDLRRVDALLADALHFVLAVGPAGLSAGVEEADEGVEFEALRAGARARGRGRRAGGRARARVPGRGGRRGGRQREA